MKVWQGVKDGRPVLTLTAETDKKLHGVLRKQVASAYSMTSLFGLEPYVNESIRYFVKRLDEEFIQNGNKDKPCDIDNWVQYCK